MNDPMNKKLIPLVQGFSHLYDKWSKGYKDKNMKQNSWRSISIVVGMTVDETKVRFKSLRDRYIRIKNKLAGKNGQKRIALTADSEQLYKNMRFSDTSIVHRPMVSNNRILSYDDNFLMNEASTSSDFMDRPYTEFERAKKIVSPIETFDDETCGNTASEYGLKESVTSEQNDFLERKGTYDYEDLNRLSQTLSDNAFFDEASMDYPYRTGLTPEKISIPRVSNYSKTSPSLIVDLDATTKQHFHNITSCVNTSSIVTSQQRETAHLPSQLDKQLETESDPDAVFLRGKKRKAQWDDVSSAIVKVLHNMDELMPKKSAPLQYEDKLFAETLVLSKSGTHDAHRPSRYY